MRFNTVKFWRMEFRKVLKSWKWWMASGTFSKIMTPNTCLDWPHNNLKTTTFKSSQSPDMNPLEHLWEHLKHCLKRYLTPPKGVHELWDRVAEEWDEISPEVCQNLIESMPSQIQAVYY